MRQKRKPNKDKKLSKTTSYALRHAPEEFGLTLSPHGFVPLDDLIAALERRGWENLSQKDFERIIRNSEKKRYEIRDGKIRALYGHSVKGITILDPSEPPEILYHGTTHWAAPKILEGGLKPMGRQYVHLSTDIETAMQVGRRRDSKPVVFEVAAKSCYDSGIPFYHVGETIWTSEAIPPRFLKQI